MTEFWGKSFTFTTSDIQPADSCICVRYLKRMKVSFSFAQKESIPNKILFSSKKTNSLNSGFKRGKS